MHLLLSVKSDRVSILWTYGWVQPTTKKRENCKSRLANSLKLKLENHILISASLLTIANWKQNITQKCLIFLCQLIFFNPFWSRYNFARDGLYFFSFRWKLTCNRLRIQFQFCEINVFYVWASERLYEVIFDVTDKKLLNCGHSFLARLSGKTIRSIKIKMFVEWANSLRNNPR